MKEPLKIVFLGTPEFALQSLKAIVEAGHEVAAVVTAVDRPAGRGQKMRSSAVKEYAMSIGLPILQPPNLKNPYFLEALESMEADLQVVVAFRMLPEVVWKMPRLGTFNWHASLLPEYRGAAPINTGVRGATRLQLTVRKHSGDHVHPSPPCRAACPRVAQRR